MTKLNNLNPCPEAKEWAEQFNTFQEAWQSCDRADWMLWLLNKLKLPTDQLARQFAYHVLHIYEERYPNDKRPRAALENPTKENITAARAAAEAAQSAAAWAAAEAAVEAAQSAAATVWGAQNVPSGLFSLGHKMANVATAWTTSWATRAAAEAAWAAVWATRAAAEATQYATLVATWTATRAAAEAAERRWQCDQIRLIYPTLEIEL